MGPPLKTRYLSHRCKERPCTHNMDRDAGHVCSVCPPTRGYLEAEGKNYEALLKSPLALTSLATHLVTTNLRLRPGRGRGSRDSFSGSDLASLCRLKKKKLLFLKNKNCVNRSILIVSPVLLEGRVTQIPIKIRFLSMCILSGTILYEST